MKSVIGKNLTLSLYGESHSESMGIIIDGLASGIPLDLDYIQSQLDKRKPKGKISTQRHEADDFVITSGFFNGFTTGTPLHLQILNRNQNSKDYQPQFPRPSHADLVAHYKYGGYQDYRGGGHFSGRCTAPIVAAGAIALQILKTKGIIVGTHIKQCKDIQDRDFNDFEADLSWCNHQDFAVLDAQTSEAMKACIETAAKDHDSVGGILESCILHCPLGIGEPFFHSLESQLSAYLFSIPAVKGVEFGLGFDFVHHYGSEVNDPIAYDHEQIITTTNNNGGINGGIANGMPIVLRCVIKPTPSIFKEQSTINLESHENTTFTLHGRHDPAIFHRARVVVDSMIACCLLDLCIEKFGTDWCRP